MRLTADLIRSAPTYVNPLKERELGLRGFKIPAIENLGVTADQYESIDMSDNDLVRFANMPLLSRLHALLLNNNRLAKIEPGLGAFLPNLTTLLLSNNKFTALADLLPLEDIKSITHLSLTGNPVTAVKNYRLFVISRLPKLKVLDFAKVRPKERIAAVAMYPPTVKKEETKEVSRVEEVKAPKTFTPGEFLPSSLQGSATTATASNGAPRMLRQEILARLHDATDSAEVDRLEKLLQQAS